MADVTETANLLRQYAVDLMDVARMDVEVETADNAPRRVGDLASSVRTEAAQATAFGASFDMEATAMHAIFIVAGTRAHEIAPTKPHGLLVWEGAGGTVFHKGPVWHDATPPDPNFWNDKVLSDRLNRALLDATRVVSIGVG